MDQECPNPPDSPKNLRRSPRSPAIVRQVKVEDSHKTFIGHLRNLSQGGMFIATMSAPRLGTTFEAEFVLPETDKVMRCRCEVVWRQAFSPASSTTPGMGVQFVEIAPEMAADIQKWVETKPHKP